MSLYPLIWVALLQLLLLLSLCEAKESPSLNVEYWLTTANKSLLFQRQPDLSFVPNAPQPADIQIDSSDAGRRQEMEGFGWCLTGGSAQLLLSQPAFSGLFPGRCSFLHYVFSFQFIYLFIYLFVCLCIYLFIVCCLCCIRRADC
jgi:hypothetical protein